MLADELQYEPRPRRPYHSPFEETTAWFLFDKAPIGKLFGLHWQIGTHHLYRVVSNDGQRLTAKGVGPPNNFRPAGDLYNQVDRREIIIFRAPAWIVKDGTLALRNGQVMLLQPPTFEAIPHNAPHAPDVVSRLKACLRTNPEQPATPDVFTSRVITDQGPANLYLPRQYEGNLMAEDSIDEDFMLLYENTRLLRLCKLRGAITPPDVGATYIVSNEPGFVKIGTAKGSTIRKRLANLSTGSRAPWHLLAYTPEDEYAVQDRFVPDHANKEFFRVSDKLQAFIDSCRDTLDYGPLDWEALNFTPTITATLSAPVMIKEEWVYALHSLHSEACQECYKLLRTRRFRNQGRRALRDRLTSWLDDPHRPPMPFTSQEWAYLVGPDLAKATPYAFEKPWRDPTQPVT